MDEKIEERKLLYYEDFSKLHRHYAGNRIYSFRFHDVKTGDEIKLLCSNAAAEIENIGFGECYEDVSDFIKHYDILWILTAKKVFPIEASYKEIKYEYDTLQNTEVDINDTLMSRHIPNYIKKCDSIQNRMTLIKGR